MSGIALFRLGQVIVSLLCIATGLSTRNDGRILAPAGVVGLISGAFYFLAGRVSLWILLPVALVALAATFVWFVSLWRRRTRLPPSQANMSRVYHVTVLLLVGNAIVTPLMLVIGPSPGPALFTFVTLCLCSVFFARVPRPQQH